MLLLERGPLAGSVMITAIPLNEYGFPQHKYAFHALHYGWLPCVHLLTVLVEHPFWWNMHALSCPKLQLCTMK